MQEIVDLAKIILSKLEIDDDKYDSLHFSLDLDTIDGIKVNSYLVFQKKYKSIKFYIDSKNISNYASIDESETISYFSINIKINFKSKTAAYSINEIVEMINKLRILIPKLKFNSTIGQFTSNPINFQESIILEKLFSFDNTRSLYQDCSVCFEKTKTKTKCHHPLCYKCWDSLTIVPSDNEDMMDITYLFGEQKCPICRLSINKIQLNNYDYDQDDGDDQDGDDQDGDDQDGDNQENGEEDR